MKCHYRTGDEEWIKGEILSIKGGRWIQFLRDGHNLDMTLSDSEVIFHSDGMSITGFMPTDNRGTYKIVSVEVTH